MHFNATILTLFPEMFPGPLGHSLAGKALEKGIWGLDTINIRDFALDAHGTVDDKSFGGGTGMVLRPDILGDAIDHVVAKSPEAKKDIYYLSPRGKTFDQPMAEQLIAKKHIILLCGRYEGVDQRVINAYNVQEISMGDFVLSGGEVAAITLLDACVRLLPDVIGNKEALSEESFGSHSHYNGLLEYPHYTRPASWRGMDVPEVLLSGNHQAIEEWRLAQAEEITKARRKDLWQKYLDSKHGA